MSVTTGGVTLIPTPVETTLWATVGGFVSVVLWFTLSVYDTTRVLDRNIIWDDDSTRRQRLRTRWDHLTDQIDTRDMVVNYVPLWYIVGFLWTFCLILFSVGIGVIYL